MRIFILPSSFKGEEEVTLTGKDRHYLINVLRLKQGMSLTARDTRGTYYTLTIESVSKDSVLLSAAEQEDGAEETTDVFSSFRGPFPLIHLFQGVGKGKKIEQIIRQCSELGITSITPVMSRYTVSDVRKNWEAKSSRYRKVAEQAIQQSGSPVLTSIGEPVEMKELFSRIEDPSRLLFFHQSLDGSTPTLFSTLKELLSEDSSSPLSLLIGPEGGLSDEEVTFLLDKGAQPVLLQTNILRTETAAVTASAITSQFAIDFISHT